jgi:GT2 family glycosyltransferase
LSVEKAMAAIDGEILVVDNNSTDGSQTFFKEKFPNVVFFWSEKNEVFAKANNRALSFAKADYILFLNPDTIVPEDCFLKCISFLKETNNPGALGIKMLDGSGRFLKESKRSFPSPSVSFYKLSGMSHLFPRSTVFAKYHLGFLDENANHEVEVLAGAFMMVPKNILNIVGGFDERFFMYGEDIDLSFRIKKAGFKNFYFSESSIIHFKGESTKKGSLNYVKMFYGAMNIFVKKHFGNSKSVWVRFLIHVSIFIRGTFAGMSGFLGRPTSSARKLKPGASEKTGDEKNIVVAATREEFKWIEQVYNKYGRQQKILGRIETGELPSVDAIGNFKDVIEILKYNSIAQIDLCEGALSFKHIIATIQLIPCSFSIKYHAKASQSIIGSDDKNAAGNYLSMD